MVVRTLVWKLVIAIAFSQRSALVHFYLYSESPFPVYLAEKSPSGSAKRSFGESTVPLQGQLDLSEILLNLTRLSRVHFDDLCL